MSFFLFFIFAGIYLLSIKRYIKSVGEKADDHNRTDIGKAKKNEEICLRLLFVWHHFSIGEYKAYYTYKHSNGRSTFFNIQKALYMDMVK